MARRTVTILTVPRDPGGQPSELGRLVDPGDGGEPFGTDPMSDKMLDGGESRTDKFDYYHAGWSNGYIQTQAA